MAWVATGSAIANVEATKPSFQFGIMILSDDFSHCFFLAQTNPKTVSLMKKSKIPMKWSVRSRLLLSILVAGFTSLMLPAWLHLPTRLLCIWDSGAICFLILTWTVMLSVTPDMMSQRAKLDDDEGRFVILSLMTTASCASLFAVGFILHDKKELSTGIVFLHITLSVTTIIASWLLVHTIFASHYAKGYYQADRSSPEVDRIGGLDFPNCSMPDYWDFLYFSFVIGMTSQVSDVQVVSRRMRRLTLLHSVMSFFFNTAILAMSINIIAGSI
jgi:uncharacterized membrane protein